MKIAVTQGATALYSEHAPFIPLRHVPAITARPQAKRYATAQTVPVLDLRDRARKDAQSKAKRQAQNKEQTRSLIGFGIFAVIVTAIAQVFFSGGDHGNN